MPPLTKNWWDGLLLLAIVWCAIQVVTAIWGVGTFRNDYVRCQTDTTCKDRVIAREWDTKRGYAAVGWAQPLQPLFSALLFGLVRKRSTSRGVHVAKAIGLGILGAAMSGVCALLIYDHYPRPGYWTLDLSEVLIFAYYFVLPIFPLASALLGGFACGRIQWTDLPEQTA